MALINFDCPECGHNLEVDEGGAGFIVKCPECGNPLQIPELPKSHRIRKAAVAAATLLTILGLFGANDGVAPAQLDLALQLGTQIGLALKTVGGQIDRLLAARRGRNVLLQTLAGLQLQRGKWHIPCTGQRLCPCRWQGADQGQQTHGRQRLGKRTDKHGTGMGG